MKLSLNISKVIKQNKKEYKQIHSLIKQYDRIAIFRHMRPDYDALGAQFGLASYIKDHFPNKEIAILGDNHDLFSGSLFPKTDRKNELWFKERFLAIIVDCANAARIADPRYKHAEKIIKIDHHPNLDEFGDINLVNDMMVSASEIIANMLLFFKGKISTDAAKYLYIGMVGDSGRFQYLGTSSHTFDIASKLLESGFSLPDVTQEMYAKPLSDLENTKKILNSYKRTEKGAAYYIVKNQDLIDMGLTVERGKDYLFLFTHIKDIPIWFSVTEDVTDKCYRISLRSKKIPVNILGEKYRGGGHELASGAKLLDINELEQFLVDVDKLI